MSLAFFPPDLLCPNRGCRHPLQDSGLRGQRQGLRRQVRLPAACNPRPSVDPLPFCADRSGASSPPTRAGYAPSTRSVGRLSHGVPLSRFQLDRVGLVCVRQLHCTPSVERLPWLRTSLPRFNCTLGDVGFASPPSIACARSVVGGSSHSCLVLPHTCLVLPIHAWYSPRLVATRADTAARSAIGGCSICERDPAGASTSHFSKPTKRSNQAR